MLGELFLLFLKAGLVSFGGGYAVIPAIEFELSARGWLSGAELQQAVVLAGMAPGSIATNTATLVGYKMAGYIGAAVATAGIILPSLVIVMLVSMFFFRLQQSQWLKSSLYGLRPVVAGFIIYAAIHFAFPGNVGRFNMELVGLVLICAGSLYLLYKYKLHPLAILIASGVAGIVLF